MTLSEILKQDKYSLPINRDNSVQIKVFIEKDILNAYLNDIRSSTDILDGISPSKYSFTSITYKNTIETIISDLLLIVDEYFSGKPANAFKLFDDFFTKTGYLNYFSTVTYPPNTSFYRIRKAHGSYPLNRKELFHIPFDKLERVTTQRFSIPGYPALYLGNSIYLCWEELNRPNLFETQCMQFRNGIQLKVLDLDWTEYHMQLHLGGIDDNKLVDYGILWPLFALCYMIVPKANVDLPFKGEYIFPQLVMQFLQNQKGWPVYAIRYPSSKAKYDTKQSLNRYHNIVMPVKKINEKGYCPILESYFSVSDVVPVSLKDIVKNSYTATGYKNSDIEKISLNFEDFFDYEETKFHELETYFQSIPFSKLTKL